MGLPTAAVARFTAQDVCEHMPWDPVTVMAHHASLAALLAGFSLTAFAVLLRRHEPTEKAPIVHRNALILLLLAVISGALSSYLFSASSGDNCLNSFEEFNVPSALLASCGLLLVGGLAVLLSEREEFWFASGGLQIFCVVLGILVFVRIALDAQFGASVAHNLKTLVPHADTTSLEAALNRAAPSGKALHGLTPAAWVAGRLVASTQSVRFFSGTPWGYIIGAAAGVGWLLLLRVRLNPNRRTLASGIWGAVAVTMLMAVVYVLVTFTVVLPSNTELIDFPAWYEVSLVGLVAISALVATTHPLDVSDHVHFRKWFTRLGQR